MATKNIENDSTTPDQEPDNMRTHRSVSMRGRPRSNSSPWRSVPLDIPKQKHSSKRPKSGKSVCPSSSPDKYSRRRKRSNSDGIAPTMPSEQDGIILGSLMAQEAAKSFWNSEMLENSLRKLKEYAADVVEQADKVKSTDDKNDTNSSTEAEELDDSYVEEIYTLEEDTCTSTSEDLLGVSDIALTSDDQTGKSDTVLTRKDSSGISDISLSMGTKMSAPLSSSLNLHSVLTSLHSLSDHQLELRPKTRHVVYSSSAMRRAHTDPCLSPRLLRLRQVPVSSPFAGTLEVCR